MAEIKKVQISHDCIGCGTCERECAGIFKLVQQTKSQVTSKRFEEHEDGVLRAFKSCPIQGIKVSSDDPSLQTLWRPATIIEKTQLTDTVIEVKIRSAEYEFKPGQFVTLHLEDGEGGFNRAYSIASLDKDVTTLLVGILKDGRASEFFQECSVPTEIRMTEPRGEFVLEQTTAPKLFIATGTGLAPIVSMIERAPDAVKTLYFGVRKESDLFYVDRLKEMPNLELKVCLDFPEDDWDGPTGNVIDFLRKDAIDPDAEIYVCGNDAMMVEVEQLLKKKSHEMGLFHRESFAPVLPAARSAAITWRIWIRNVHVYASLVMCVVFLFFGLTGFMANRPELFGAKLEQTLPANVSLDETELVGYLKSKLPETAVFKEYEKDEGVVTLTFDNGEASRIEVEVSEDDRMFSVTDNRTLPESTNVSDANALAAALAGSLSGKLNEKSIEADEDYIYFSVESVWRDVSVEVDKAENTYQMTITEAPWVTALTNLHRGKNAGPVQKLFIDSAGLVMVLVTLTGMIYALQSGMSKRRIIATVLVTISVIVSLVMLANR